jgi:hypothetical protein
MEGNSFDMCEILGSDGKKLLALAKVGEAHFLASFFVLLDDRSNMYDGGGFLWL